MLGGDALISMRQVMYDVSNYVDGLGVLGSWSADRQRVRSCWKCR